MAYSDDCLTNMNDAATGGLLAAFGHIWLFTLALNAILIWQKRLVNQVHMHLD